MEIDLVRSFLAVLDEGSLNKAAVHLHLAQSTLTRQMHALEQEAGGQLLERTSAGVAPTASGQAFATRMRPVLAAFDAALDEVRELAQGRREQIRIGYLLSAGRSYLNPALAVLRMAHPLLKVKLLDLSPGEQIEALRAGEIDVGLLGQEGRLVAKEFYVRKIATLSVVAVLPDTHRLASRPELRLADLKGETFIGTPERHVPGRNQWITGLCRKAGFRPRFTPPSESLEQAISAVVSEGAVMLLPDHVRDFVQPGIVVKSISDPGVSWDFLVVWQRGRTAAAVKTLVDALAAGRKRSE